MQSVEIEFFINDLNKKNYMQLISWRERKEKQSINKLIAWSRFFTYIIMHLWAYSKPQSNRFSMHTGWCIHSCWKAFNYHSMLNSLCTKDSDDELMRSFYNVFSIDWFTGQQQWIISVKVMHQLYLIWWQLKAWNALIKMSLYHKTIMSWIVALFYKPINKISLFWCN